MNAKRGTRSSRCSQCGRATAIVRNPYFRVGLAVHPYFRVCRVCNTVVFVDRSPDGDSDGRDVPPAPVSPPDAPFWPSLKWLRSRKRTRKTH